MAEVTPGGPDGTLQINPDPNRPYHPIGGVPVTPLQQNPGYELRTQAVSATMLHRTQDDPSNSSPLTEPLGSSSYPQAPHVPDTFGTSPYEPKIAFFPLRVILHRKKLNISTYAPTLLGLNQNVPCLVMVSEGLRELTILEEVPMTIQLELVDDDGSRVSMAYPLGMHADPFHRAFHVHSRFTETTALVTVYGTRHDVHNLLTKKLDVQMSDDERTRAISEALRNGQRTLCEPLASMVPTIHGGFMEALLMCAGHYDVLDMEQTYMLIGERIVPSCWLHACRGCLHCDARSTRARKSIEYARASRAHQPTQGCSCAEMPVRRDLSPR